MTKKHECVCSVCGKINYRTKCNINASLAKHGDLACRGCRNRKGVRAAITVAWDTITKSSMRRGISFELSYEEWLKIVTSNCYYCGQEPNHSVASKSKTCTSFFIKNGVDRVDSNEGYTLSNCVPCCQQCNYGKHTYSQEDFIEMCNRVARLHPR